MFQSLPEDTEGKKTKSIKPTPGFCVKAKDRNGDKVFLNICHTVELPEPKEISDAELIKILESDDPSSYKVPLSLGLPHDEVDKSGSPCKAYDIIVNSNFFSKMKKNELFKRFLITIALDGIEDKYGVNAVGDDYVILKNKRYLGTMPDHCIQDRSGPLIAEVEGAAGDADQAGSSEKKSTLYLTRHSLPGQPDTLVARISLPGVKSAKDLALDVGEDRIVLKAERPSYSVDVFVPCLLNQDGCQAEFNAQHQVLTVMMPIQHMA